ncbi:MAG: restriction endonuclease subunit S [Lewinellaceae bacterium]|nr:restriction endonuclease subunit S [Lewinellaceae bacterium]
MLRQIASTEWIAISPVSYVASKFLMYACTSPYFREILNSSVSGVGGSLQRARPSEVYGYPIPLPPLAEQRRIVAKLDAAIGRLRAVKVALERVPDMLEQLRQSVLHWAVTGG